MAFNSTPQAVHVDEFLTSFAINFAQEQNYLADKVFPVLDVEKQSDKYYVFDAAEENRESNDLVTKLAPRTEPRKFEITQSQDNYFAEVYGAGFDIDTQTAANEDAVLRTRQRKARRLMNELLAKRDRDFISTYMTTGVWGADLAGTTDFTKWSDAASTPIDDIMKWKEDFAVRNYGIKANKIVLTPDIKRVLMGNAQILGRINGGATVSNPAMINDSILAGVFEVESIVYADAVTNRANVGEAENAGYMVEDQLLMVHTPSDVGMDTAASGMIFAWNSIPDVSWGITMESFTDDALARQQLAEVVHGKMAYDMKVTGSNLGTYVTDLI